MAVTPIFPILLITVVARCKCDHTNRFISNNGYGNSKFGNLLKPPPPPSLSQVLPVPFYGGRNQRQNVDVSYQSPPPLPPSSQNSAEFKFPAPFYEQYNFNFLRSPQPFTTTPAPSLFQKVSTWLFPSQQTSYDIGSIEYNKNNNNISPVKKDCNPCNLVPWIPVIRYNNLGTKNDHQNSLPTYGPPSPTAFAQNLLPKQPQPYYVQNDQKNVQQFIPGVPQVTYNSPSQSYRLNSDDQVIATYGPPSPTHIQTNLPNSLGTTNFIPSNSYKIPNLSINSQENVEEHPSSFLPSTSQRQLSSSYVVSSTYKPATFFYATPSATQHPSSFYGSPHMGTHSLQPVTQPLVPEILSKEVPKESDVEILKSDDNLEEQRLPKVIHQTRFRNSYGDPITNKNVLDVPYSMSAIAAESTKIHTQVLPEQTMKRSNMSLALANPAPFTLNKGRNIHTLQPVALPNLSVSPLPPIFNARPFRPITSTLPAFVSQGVNQMQAISNNVNVAQSVPLVEFTHSIDYPATFIQSPVIDISISKDVNQTKEYRHITNSFIIDEIRDITSQASEDHISATKTVSDSSFESTGSDIGNDLHDISTPTDLKESPNIHTYHQDTFNDLRGVKDEDVDKYRIESNLQNIDSPLLYLKPSIPHKKHGNFVENVSISPTVNNEYEIYDEIPLTTDKPSTSYLSWDDSRSDYTENVNPSIKEHEYKPNIVQIIIPYTTGGKDSENDKDFTQVSQSWTGTSGQEFQARKVPLNTENSQTSTEHYSTQTVTTTEEPKSLITENYGLDQYNSELNDFYDVKDPPFDIVKLQHTIDDWTEQEYSKESKTLHGTRSSESYAKQIPDEYFTTTVPTNYETETNNYNYDLFDHESASSILYSVAEDKNKNFTRPRKEYNTIERTKSKPNTEKSNVLNDSHKHYIYTAASSFRTSTTTTSTITTTTSTTPAPWGKIETSISPLTKEKVYVVTSKPWKETRNQTSGWYEELNSMKTYLNKDVSASDGLPFQSPRFINRPSFGFTSGGKVESVKSDSLFGFSRSWYQSINDLENQGQNNTSFQSEHFQQDPATNLHEDSTITSAKPHRLRNV